MLTIAPRRSISPGSVAFASIQAALRSTAKTESQSSSVIATASKYAFTPALLTRPSRPPSACSALGDGTLDLRERPHVAREEVRGTAVGEARGGVGARRVDVEQSDGAALLDDRLGDGRADPARCARDEDGLAVEQCSREDERLVEVEPERREVAGRGRERQHLVPHLDAEAVAQERAAGT